MNDEVPIEELFDSLIQDKTENKIIKLLIQDKDSEEIVEELLNPTKKVHSND